MSFIRLSIAFLLLAVVAPASAADAQYPPGSRVGLEPPPGMVASRSFVGFEDRANEIAFLLAALPDQAYPEIAKSLTAEALKKQGITVETIETLTLPVGKAILAVGQQRLRNSDIRKWLLVVDAATLTAVVTVQIPLKASKIYPDELIRKALLSVSVRPSVPQAEQLELVPFKVTNLADFRVGAVVPGVAAILVDQQTDKVRAKASAQMLIAAARGEPGPNDDRNTFAFRALSGVPNLKDVRVVSAEPLRIGGRQGHQLIAEGKHGETGVAIKLIQWLRFGSGGYLQIVGISSRDGWDAAYPRFRAVRDGIDRR